MGLGGGNPPWLPGEIYARADTEMKRKAIENVYPDLVDSSLPDWSKDQALLSWLSEIQ
jgi:integrase/recombinase XerD